MERSWNWPRWWAQLKPPLVFQPRTETQRVIPVCLIAPQNRTSSCKLTQQEVLWRAQSPSPLLHHQLCSGEETPLHPRDWVKSLSEIPATLWTLQAGIWTWRDDTAGAVRSQAPPPIRHLRLCPVITCPALCQGTGSPPNEDPGPTSLEKNRSPCPSHQAVEARSHVHWVPHFCQSSSPASFFPDHLQGNHLSGKVQTTGLCTVTIQSSARRHYGSFYRNEPCRWRSLDDVWAGSILCDVCKKQNIYFSVGLNNYLCGAVEASVDHQNLFENLWYHFCSRRGVNLSKSNQIFELR